MEDAASSDGVNLEVQRGVAKEDGNEKLGDTDESSAGTNPTELDTDNFGSVT